LPAVWVANQALEDLLKRRKPILNAKRLLTNQTFRDIYRTETLAIGQRLKILSLTFLFSDLKGSAELYERVGDSSPSISSTSISGCFRRSLPPNRVPS
jgi:class 3 adenylate cyclase